MLTNSILTAFIVISIVELCAAHWDGAYMGNPEDGFTEKTSWMSEIRDDVKLSEMALPGTGSSGCFDVSRRPPEKPLYKNVKANLVSLLDSVISLILNDAKTTQALNVEDQLNYGIRAFDIEVVHIADSLVLTYGSTLFDMTLYDVLDAVQFFLMNNSNETVLINLHATKDIPPAGNSLSVEGVIDEYLNEGIMRDFYLPTNDVNITLGEARGKFILMTRETEFSSRSLTLTDANSKVMDKMYLRTNWDLHDYKWMPVKSFLNETIDSSENKIFINFINGHGGSFPYFVASGHSSSGTSAPILATGLTTPGWKHSYPDFPRVDCFIGICTTAFEGTNILTRDLIRQINEEGNFRRTVGIILIDFPGEDLINTIINNNKRLRK